MKERIKRRDLVGGLNCRKIIVRVGLICLLLTITLAGCRDKDNYSATTGERDFYDSYDNLHFNWGAISHDKNRINYDLMAVTLNGVRVLKDQDDAHFPRSTVVIYPKDISKLRYKRLDILTGGNNLFFVDENKEGWLFKIEQETLNESLRILRKGEPNEIIKVIGELQAMKKAG